MSLRLSFLWRCWNRHMLQVPPDAANRHCYSRHPPAMPLYTLKDAEAARPDLAPVPFGTDG